MTYKTSFDIFGLPEMPTFILCNPNKEELYSLGSIVERKYSPRFNAFSELEFRADEYVDGILMPYYDYLVHRRLVYSEGLGYFMITSVNEKGDGITKYKEISCKSIEVELMGVKLSLFKGTYEFYDVINPEGTLMQEIIDYLPGWTLGHIDTDIAIKYRTFDVSDSTIYNFLVTEVSEAYQCVFIFDNVYKTISAYDVPNATTNTDIYISYDNVIENIEVEEVTDNLVTALTVLGGDGLGINRVNPLGTNNIYNFTYFKTTDWMNQSLIDAITAWEVLVASKQTDYADLLTQLLDGNQELLENQNELDNLKADLAVAEIELAALIQQGASTSAQKAIIDILEDKITITEDNLEAQQAVVDDITAQLDTIVDELSFENNFTSSQIIELQPFIIQSSYINENFSLHDNYTSVQMQEESQMLYDQAMDVLARVSEPRYSFDVDSVNFMMIEDFQSFIDQITLGAIINLEIKEGVITYPVLLGYDLNFDDPTDFKLLFGNRLRLDNEAFQYSDLMEEAIKASTTSKVNSRQWSSWTDNYKNSVSTFISSSLDASLNNVISGSSQEILINQSGIRCRTMGIDGTYSPEQMWIVNNMLAFTNDNWNTAKMAIGEFTLDSGDSAWGIIADYLVGKVIAGNELTIVNDNNTFTVDGSGATLTNATFTIDSTSGNGKILLDPTNGICIQKNVGGSWENQLCMDTNGNLIMSGTVTAAAGNIGGWAIQSDGLYAPNGDFIKSNGNIKLGAMTISSTGNSYFSGNIYANNLLGLVQDYQISSLNASKITAGTMSADRIRGGTITGTTISGVNIYNSAFYGGSIECDIVAADRMWVFGASLDVDYNANIDGTTTTGTLNVLGSIKSNGTSGITATRTVRNSTNTGTSTLRFKNGIYIGGT